ncbi:hypothetical protein OG911_11725 [Streptomyces sp. NBC_00208]|uniref:hypothetical protein n=1 Tax=Streptomyces sp. NBC_00208 TaxID=2975681 RepID=UPI002E2B84B5|nr:hypothetical protein [Streptomyces sp. NBC_00208]
MNGYEHYQRAEEELEHCARYGTNPDRVAIAQVHALLAHTAAMADAARFRDELYSGNGEEPPAKVARKRNAADKSASAADLYL